MSADSPSRELRCFRRSRRCLQWALLMLTFACAAAMAGCQSPTGKSALITGVGPLAGLTKKSALDKRESIDGIKGPTERKLQQASWEQEQRDAAAAGGIERIEGLADYQAAKRLYDAKRYADAEKAFKALAKDRRNRGLSFTERFGKALRTGVSDPSADSFGDPVEEDALFMLAESQFMQKKYSWAQDSYDKLLERFPSSRHLDQVTRRMFRIAQVWMGFPDTNGQDNVELASAELQKTNPRIGNRNFKRPGFLNVTDRSRPVFDTAGRALQALQSIWLNDAGGPLADDALMLTANYHLQTGNFIEAARVYQLLREQYPDSPHFKDAYLLDSHVRLASYDGPAYDGRALQESRNLRETAQRLFPDLDPEQRERLDAELKRIAVSEVAREWHKVEFYQSKGSRYEASVALHCHVILNRYPDSPYAERARKVLEGIADHSRQPRSNTLDILTGAKTPPLSPVLAGLAPSTPQSRQTARHETPQASPPVAMPKPEPAATATTRKPGFMGRLLTPVQQTPKLQPVEPGSSSTSDAKSRIQTLKATTPGRTPL
ncbi:MAG: tetratricopeptide repeat protein [Planctomycetaceae bacterium]